MTSTTFQLPRLDTGMMPMNYMTGGGIPIGSTFGVLGNDETGKDLLGLHFIRQGQVQNMNGVFVDSDRFVAEAYYTPRKNAKFNFQGLGIDVDRMACLVQKRLDIDAVAEHLIPVMESEPVVVVINDLASYVHAHLPYPHTEKRQLHLAQSKVRAALSRMAVAAQESGSLLVTMDNPHVSQFAFIPPASLGKEDDLHMSFPMHLLSGVCKLIPQRLEKLGPSTLSGEIIRAEMIHSRCAQPHLRDELYVDFVTGYSPATDLRTVIRVARDQGVLQVKAEKNLYYLNYSKCFKPQSGLNALQRYLSQNQPALLELIKNVAWGRTVYDCPVV